MKKVLEVLAGIGAIALMMAFIIALMTYASIKEEDLREQRIAPYRHEHLNNLGG